MRLAVQLFTLRDDTTSWDGLDRALGRCADLGYVGAQVSAVGCLGDRPDAADGARVREMLDRRGMVSVGTHRPWRNLVEELDREVAFHRELGGEIVGLGHPGDAFAQSADGYEEFAARASAMDERLRAHGLRFGYHNHDGEFVRDGGRTRFDRLVEATEIPIILDVYWVQHAGHDPAKWIDRLKNRVSIVHFKDKEVADNVGPVMAPVGEGNLDWPAIVAACHFAGTQWATVEQDVCRRDPYDCLASSARFLSAMPEVSV